MKKKLIRLSLLLLTSITYSQVGINTNNPHTTLDVSAKRDDSGNILDNTKNLGIQAPRISLAELSSNTAIYDNNQKGALIYITDLTNGNQSGQRVNITKIGYYYFDGSIWQKISTAIDEPWYVQNSTTQSTSNNENIYQNGNVSIKKKNGIKDVDLDVLGSIRAAGSGRLLTETITNPDTAGKNSVGLGLHTEAQGESSISIGNNSLANGKESISIGYHTQAVAEQEIVLGRYNSITNGNSNDSSILTDPLIQIGNGTSSNSNNAMTILKNGQIGINIPGQNNNAKPDPSAIIDIQSTNKGFLPPRVVLTNSTMQLGTSPNAVALWVYNVGGANNLPSGYYYWNGSVWTSFEVVTSTSPAIATLQCNSAYLNPASYAANSPFSGNLRITYNQGNGGKYGTGSPITINGLTFQLRPGNLEYGDGELIFSVTGTPLNSDNINIPMNSSLIPFLQSSQNCTTTIGNNSRADIINIAVMGYPTLTTDANSKQAYTLPLSTPDGKYAIRVIFDTTSGTTAAIPNVQLYNNTGSNVDLYWNYNTEYGGYLGSAVITKNVTHGVWGGMNDSSATWYPQGSGAVSNSYWGNVGIIDGAGGGPEHRRYTWIDSNSSSKTAYTATIMVGAPTNGSAQPVLSKIFIKIEQVKAL